MGFLLSCGGFHLFECSLKGMGKDDQGISQDDNKPLHPLQFGDLVDCYGYNIRKHGETCSIAGSMVAWVLS